MSSSLVVQDVRRPGEQPDAPRLRASMLLTPVNYSHVLAECVPTTVSRTAIGFRAGKQPASNLRLLFWNIRAGLFLTLHPLPAFSVLVERKPSNCGEDLATTIAGKFGASFPVQMKTFRGGKHPRTVWTLWPLSISLLWQRLLQIFHLIKLDFFPNVAILLLLKVISIWHEEGSVILSAGRFCRRLRGHQCWLMMVAPPVMKL